MSDFPATTVNQQVHEGRVVDETAADAGDTTLISDIPCGRQRRIDVAITSDLNLSSVDLVFSANGGRIVVVQNLGSVTGGTDALFQYTGAMGELVSLRVSNAAGGDATVSAYLCAKGD